MLVWNEDGEMLGLWEGLFEVCYFVLVYVIGVENLNIVGFGILDGGGDCGDWWLWYKEICNGVCCLCGFYLIDCWNI